MSKNKSTKLPDPPILTDRKEPAYDDWLAKMQSKLEANQDHFPTQALQIGYIQSRVVGTAALHINPRLRPTAANKFKTADEIFEVLTRCLVTPIGSTLLDKLIESCTKTRTPLLPFRLSSNALL